MEGEVAQRLLGAVMEQARSQDLWSEEPFTVDGTMREAWASRNSWVPQEPATGGGTGARGRKCWRDTPEPKTDRPARV